MSGDAALESEIAAMVKELESLALDKASRDRRLVLNSELEAARKRLEVSMRRAELSAALAAVQTELTTATDKQQRRELSKRRSELESALQELG